jgi:glycosyltransferase involved in cell wall biosynthesis
MHKIAVSKWLADMARGEFDDDNVSLVPNSVDLTQFQSPPRGKQATPTVGTVYSTKPYRGCRQVFEAVERAAKQISNLQLVTFGIGPEDRDELPVPARGTHHTMPPQEQIPQIYSSCDAWLFGSEAEGFGLPILEAFACRTPVIATRAGAAPELLNSGERMPGALVDYDNIDEMAAAIVRVLSQSPEDWKRMSDAAFEIAQSYSWDDATDLFERALMTAAGRKKKCVSI